MTSQLRAGMVWLESPISETSLNLARSLGSALVSSLWDAEWIYAIAPPLGAAIAAAAFRLFEGDVLTSRLFHVSY